MSGIRSKNRADRKTPPEKQEHRLKISFLLDRPCPDELTKVSGINEATRVATNMPTEKKYKSFLLEACNVTETKID